MSLNRNLSSIHSYPASRSTIADRGDTYETNKKDDSLEIFGPTTSLTMQPDDNKKDNSNEGNSGPAPISGSKVGDLTERNQLDDPISPLDVPQALSYLNLPLSFAKMTFITAGRVAFDSYRKKVKKQNLKITTF